MINETTRTFLVNMDLYKEYLEQLERKTIEARVRQGITGIERVHIRKVQTIQ